MQNMQNMQNMQDMQDMYNMQNMQILQPGPLFLPPRLPWRGAHSYLRAHIWLVVICELGKSRRFLGGEIINFALWIILGLED